MGEHLSVIFGNIFFGPDTATSVKSFDDPTIALASAFASPCGNFTTTLPQLVAWQLLTGMDLRTFVNPSTDTDDGVAEAPSGHLGFKTKTSSFLITHILP